MMTNRRWLLLTLFTLLALFGANLLLTYQLDVFGILRDPQGRRLATNGLHVASTDDRVSKYLLNQRYVPSNFDGLLIGSSTTGNWDPDLIHGYRIYNESLAAGNASEEKALVEQALPTGHFRVALCVLSPYIFSDHTLKQGMGQVRRSEAIGSLNSFGEEGAKALAVLHLQKNTFSPSGSRELFVQDRDLLNADLSQIFPVGSFHPDPQAIADLRSLVQDLQAHGVKVVYIVPPLYKPAFDGHSTEFNNFVQRMQSELPPAPIINFTDPEYDAYNSDPKNFSDGLHMRPEGAVKISKILDQKLNALLGS